MKNNYSSAFMAKSPLNQIVEDKKEKRKRKKMFKAHAKAFIRSNNESEEMEEDKKYEGNRDRYQRKALRKTQKYYRVRKENETGVKTSKEDKKADRQERKDLRAQQKEIKKEQK